MNAVNSIISFFDQWKELNSYNWHDDPRRFIQDFLNVADNIMSEELYIVEQAWKLGSPEERAQAKSHLETMLQVIPKRDKGELVYILAFLGDQPEGSHVTLLGPAYFPNEESCFNFFSAVREFAGDHRKLEANIVEELRFPVKDGIEHIVHKVEMTMGIQSFHMELVGLAESLGASLLEEEYSKDNFIPHVTHHLGCEIGDGSKFELDHIAFSVHPGAKINIASSEIKGNFRLRD